MALSGSAVNRLAVALASPTVANEVAAFLPSTAANNTWSGTNTFSGDLAHTGTNLGFFGTTVAARPSAYTLTYSTKTRTNSNLTAVSAATTASTSTSPFGYAQSQADAIVTNLNALVVDMANVKQVLTQVVTDLQTLGLLQ